LEPKGASNSNPARSGRESERTPKRAWGERVEWGIIIGGDKTSNKCGEFTTFYGGERRKASDEEFVRRRRK